MHGERQLDYAEIWTQVPASLGEGKNQPLADLLCEGFKLRDRKLVDICGRVDGVE
jgi:hypothetical protein